MLLLRGSPEANASWAALAKLATECWRSANGGCTLGTTLPELLSAVDRVVASPPSSWQQVRGPVGAAFLEARRLGWELQPRGRVKLHDGELIDLVRFSPAFLDQHAKVAYQQLQRMKLKEKWAMPGLPALAPVLH